MSGVYVIAAEGLADLASIDDLSDEVLTAAYRAINKTTAEARTLGAKEIRRQVAFPARYLSGQDGRLRVSKLASKVSLSGIVQGRHRPTSLARFATSGAPGPRQNGVRVQVKPGLARYMRRAFLLRLRAGAGLTDTKFNLGLAIRLKPGESVRNKREMVRLQGNLYLLYGPSVDQVFESVAEDISPQAVDRLEAEFLRLMDL